MDKISEIGGDISELSETAISFWKHVGQLLIEVGSAGAITFDEERKEMPEEQLSEIQGKYLKLKFKNPTPVRGPEPLDYSTPINETLLGQDSTDADPLFFDDSKQMQE